MRIRINIYVLVSALAVSAIVCSYTLGADVDDKAFSYDDYDRDYLMKGNFRIRYSKYDWSLNEQLIQV